MIPYGNRPADNQETPGAILRPWREEDASALARHADNPRVSARMRDGFPSSYTVDHARRFIAMAAGSGHALFLAIEVQGEAAGSIGIHPLGNVYSGTAEIAYWPAGPLWGKGMVTGAVRALAPVVFQRPRLLRIPAGIFPDNPASMRVLGKSGFVRGAVHRDAITKQGVVMDEVMYARLRDGKT